MNAVLHFSAAAARQAWSLMRERFRPTPDCERFFSNAVDHCDLKQRMSRWEHTAAQIRAPW